MLKRLQLDADLITIQDLDAITSILYQTFEIPPFKRNYDAAFGQVSAILYRYGIIENPRNLRFRFTLCMQEFFDSIPQDQWRTSDLYIQELHRLGLFLL